MAHITLTQSPDRYVVRAGDAVLGDTRNAISLREGGSNPVIYVPRADMAMALLEKTTRQTTCPHKGVASYYSVVLPTGRLENVVWSYESPRDDIAGIAGHLAFYTDRVTVERV